MPAVSAPRNTSIRKWLAVATTTKVTTSGYRHHASFAGLDETSRAIGQHTITAKQTCIDGTAAFAFRNAFHGPSSIEPVPPVTNCEIESVKPHSGSSRGGAV